MRQSVMFSSIQTISQKKQALQLSTRQLFKSFFARQNPVFYADLPFIWSYRILKKNRHLVILFLYVGQSIKKQRYHFADKGSYSERYGFSGSQIWM